MNILFVTYGLPVPPDSGARIRDFNLISRIAAEHDVSVLSLLEFPDELDHAEPLRAICSNVDGVVARRSWLGTAVAAIGGFLEGRPVATTPFIYRDLAQRIREMTGSRQFDVVQIEHSFLAPYRDALAPGYKGATVLSLHNIGAQQYRSMYDMSSGAARLPAAIKRFLMRGWEAAYAQQFDRTIVVSDRDRERLLETAPGCRVAVIENGVDCNKLRPLAMPQPDRQEILFVGTMGYLPNRDGARYFCREILPIIRESLPDCRLTIAGSGGLEHLSDLARPGLIEITGRVADLQPYYARSRVAVVPLRSGGGSRLKILEAMAFGRPVVSTSLGREGLDLVDGREILTADEPGTFARQVVTLIEDQQRWTEQVSAARLRVEQSYDWSLIAGRLDALYGRLCRARPEMQQEAGDAAGSRSAATPRISVVVPVYNMRDDLSKCIDALEKSAVRDYQLIVVDDHSNDGSGESARARCDYFVRQDRNQGQAAARNLGARFAKADLLFFLDADVLVEPGTLGLVLEAFENEPGISALFCSYQHDTLPGNFVSQFKNLQHHYTHQVSSREAATFCGGFGAIRRPVFEQHGGFDESQRAMEDVELGYRLHRAGHRISLCPWIQLTHTKKYSLGGLVKSDVLQRAIPWTRVMLEQRVIRNDLNTKSNNITSVLVVFLMCMAPFLPWFWSRALPLAEVVLLLILVLLNRKFLAFLRRKRGARFALRAIPMIWLQYVYSGFGLVLGVLSFGRERFMALAGSSAGRPK